MKDGEEVRQKACAWEGKGSEVRNSSALEMLEKVRKCIPPLCLQKKVSLSAP